MFSFTCYSLHKSLLYILFYFFGRWAKIPKEDFADGKTVKIAGFGTFIVRKKGARKGRNLKTGEEIPIAPRKVVTFKASNQFKAMVEKPPL